MNADMFYFYDTSDGLELNNLVLLSFCLYLVKLTNIDSGQIECLSV